MSEHKHAALLRALADGESLDEFEARTEHVLDWRSVAELISSVIYHPSQWEVRRKPRTININGIEVPEPCRVPPKHSQTYYLASWTDETVSETSWRGFECEQRWFKRGLIHMTAEAAETHAKALLSFTKAEE
jgi:hypothetical protein